jgi:anti-sigma factor RsiW
MIHDHRVKKAHQEISALIPWYVNGTIGEPERQRVDSHLLTCAVCRDEMLHERRIYQGMAAEPGVEYMPAASLKRLQARLDALDAVAAVDEPAVLHPVRQQPVPRTMPWPRLAAASIAVIAVIAGLMMTDQGMQLHARGVPPLYRTVTTSEPRSPDEVIRAVFSPTITLVELQAILDEAQLRIISGPTEAGVYSLAANSGRPVNTSLALLRRHAEVRFAESTRPDAKPNHSGVGEPP